MSRRGGSSEAANRNGRASCVSGWHQTRNQVEGRAKGLSLLGEHSCLIYDLVGVGYVPTCWEVKTWELYLIPHMCAHLEYQLPQRMLQSWQ